MTYAFAQDENSGDKDSLLGVFRSADGGNTWKNVAGSHFVDRGQLPDVPHHAVLVLPGDPKRVFVCNDVGVFASQDGGDGRT